MAEQLPSDCQTAAYSFPHQQLISRLLEHDEGTDWMGDVESEGTVESERHSHMCIHTHTPSTTEQSAVCVQ